MIHADFARSLSLLRQEKGISQRQAAGALGISQALLSHYENGVRAPGLAFVVRACDFYNVSADFLLGRTLSRDGTTILDVDTLFDASAQPDNLLKGSVMATLSKKLVVNSVGVLFDLLGKLDNKKAIRAATNFLSTSVYILFRHLRRTGSDSGDSLFSVPKEQFMAGLPRVDLILNEADYLEALTQSKGKHKFPDMSHDQMMDNYPGTYQSLLQIIHACGERLNGDMKSHRDRVK